MHNAFPIQSFRSLPASAPFISSALFANASDLIGFDKGVHESGEYQEIVIKTPTGEKAILKLTHHSKNGSEVAFWEFTHILSNKLKVIIFND